MLRKSGVNGYDETSYTLHIPDEYCSPGLEVGIIFTARGINMSGQTIAWKDVDAMRKLALEYSEHRSCQGYVQEYQFVNKGEFK